MCPPAFLAAMIKERARPILLYVAKTTELKEVLSELRDDGCKRVLDLGSVHRACAALEPDCRGCGVCAAMMDWIAGRQYGDHAGKGAICRETGAVERGGEAQVDKHRNSS